MKYISGILDALKIGTPENDFKLLIRERLADKQEALFALEQYVKAPEIWKTPLEHYLNEAVTEKDEEIIRAAQTVIQGSHAGIVGDNATVEGGIDIHHGDRIDADSARDAVISKDRGMAGIFRSEVEDARGSVHGNIETVNQYFNFSGSDTGYGNEFQDEIMSYCEKAGALHGNLPLAGFRTLIRVPVLVEDIYVPLGAMIDRRGTGRACFADASDAENKLRKSGMECADNEISVPEAFRHSEEAGRKGIVILGDPGSGKTTHLKRLLLWCLKGDHTELGLPADMIPVFLPLRELRNLESGLDVFVQAQLDSPHLNTPEGFGPRMLERGNLLFLLDGLDEVSELDRRGKVSRWIEDAARVHSSCRFAVTCRFAGYSENARLNENFLEMHMRPLTSDQAEAFVRNWHNIVEAGLSSDREQAAVTAQEKAGRLIERLREPEFRARRVFEMTRNPLLLTNLCLVSWDRGRLPQGRARLYEECTDVLLELWRGSAGIKTKVDARSGKQVLQPAAFWMHRKKGRTRAKASDLKPVIEPALKTAGWTHGTAEEFLDAVRNESGLLTGWDQEYYGFMHLGFQEYLAAREIQNRAFGSRKILSALADKFGDSWWQEVILLMLALQNPSLFNEFMREAVKLPAFAENPDFAEMCLDDAAEKSVLPFTELLEKKPGKNRGLWKRQLAALRIAETIDFTAVEKLSALLKNHPHDRIRERIRELSEEELQDVIISEPGGYELVRISGGTFMMGSPETEKGRYNDEILHKVHVSDFYMGRYPVTNEEYGRFLEANPNTDEPGYWANREFNKPRQPVVGVRWHDAKKYAEWAGLRLPTEAEWEFACRAGTKSRYYFGDDENLLSEYAWFNDNSDGRTHTVGQKKPNTFGLYDMHGNVLEWCQDSCDWDSDKKLIITDTYRDGLTDPENRKGSSRVLRGGFWGNDAGSCRSAYRGDGSTGHRNRGLGFRLSREQTFNL